MMKKTLIMFAMMAVTSMTYAQSQRPEPPSAEKIIEMATKELTLSEEQVTEWETIHEKYADAMKERKTARETREKMDEELKATLTENQLEIFVAAKEKQRERPKRGPRE